MTNPATPPPPVNVRIVYPGGRVVPVDFVYVGDDDDGLRVWEITTPVTFTHGMEVMAEVLPPRTTLTLPGAPPIRRRAGRSG